MKTNSLFWAMSWVAVGSFAIMQGCGGDDDDDGGDGGDGGGKGGSSGSSSGGSSTGGKGGSSGSSTGGKGGSSTGGTSTGGSAGAPGGAGGEGGGEGGAGPTLTRAQACEQYCQMYVDKDCETSQANTYEGANPEATCRDTCNAADWELGSPGDAAGDSVHCRLTHAGLASATNPPDETHCGHASAEPTGVCVD